MKYIIQIFKVSGDNIEVGSWHDTNFGGDDIDEVAERIELISQTPNRPFSKVRMLEIVKELDCDFGVASVD